MSSLEHTTCHTRFGEAIEPLSANHLWLLSSDKYVRALQTTRRAPHMLSTKMCTTPNRHATNSMDSISRTDTSSVCCHTHTHAHTHICKKITGRDHWLTCSSFLLVLYHQPEKMVRSKEDLSERQENLERLKQQHGIEWWKGGVCLVQLGYLLQASSCRLSNMVSGLGFLAFVVFYYIFLFDSYGFRGSSTLGKLPVTVSGNDTEWMNGLSRIHITGLVTDISIILLWGYP